MSWKTRDGSIVNIRLMTNEHLINAYKQASHWAFVNRINIAGITSLTYAGQRWHKREVELEEELKRRFMELPEVTKDDCDRMSNQAYIRAEMLAVGNPKLNYNPTPRVGNDEDLEYFGAEL